MKKSTFITCVFFAVVLIFHSCKTPEEKMKEKFLENSTSFLEKTNQGKITNVKIKKIDTITPKRELTIIQGSLLFAAQSLQPEVQALDDKYRKSQRDYDVLGGNNESGYLYNQYLDDYNDYKDIKRDYDFLTYKADEFAKKAKKNKSNQIIRYNVIFTYSIKDQFDMVANNETILPFTKDGDLQNMKTVFPELYKKYDVEFLLDYLSPVLQE